MGRPATNSDVPRTAAYRSAVGFDAASVGVMASEPAIPELDESSLVVLVKFFQLLDHWHREANSRC
jgi:hypothetical protein